MQTWHGMLEHAQTLAKHFCLTWAIHDLCWKPLAGRSNSYLDVVPKVNQVLANSDKGLGVLREENFLFSFTIKDAPYLAITL